MVGKGLTDSFMVKREGRAWERGECRIACVPTHLYLGWSNVGLQGPGGSLWLYPVSLPRPLTLGKAWGERLQEGMSICRY